MKNPYLPLPVTHRRRHDRERRARHQDLQARLRPRGGPRGLRLPARPVRGAVAVRQGRVAHRHRLLSHGEGAPAVLREAHGRASRASCTPPPRTKMGVRGPLGHPFPWERLEGKNIVIVSGGFAFTTLRSAITYMLDPAQPRRASATSPRSTARASPASCSTRAPLTAVGGVEATSRSPPPSTGRRTAGRRTRGPGAQRA